MAWSVSMYTLLSSIEAPSPCRYQVQKADPLPNSRKVLAIVWLRTSHCVAEGRGTPQFLSLAISALPRYDALANYTQSSTQKATAEVGHREEPIHPSFACTGPYNPKSQK